MNDIPVSVQIAMSEVADQVKAVDGLETKLRVSMRLMQSHWLCTDEDERFRAAVGAVMVDYGYGSLEFHSLEVEMLALRRLSAAIEAAQVGLTVSNIGDYLPEGYEPIGLLNLWREAKELV